MARFAQAHGLPSLTIATLRLGLAALLITPLALWQSGHTLRALTRQQGLLTVGAGFFLALHFATWITSLEYTSVASSTALVTTNLLWIGIASFLLFGERPSRLMLVGVVISLSGSLLIFWSDSRSNIVICPVKFCLASTPRMRRDKRMTTSFRFLKGSVETLFETMK